MSPNQAGKVAEGLGKQPYSVQVLAQAAAVLYNRAGWQMKASSASTRRSGRRNRAKVCRIINYVVASGVLKRAD